MNDHSVAGQRRPRIDSVAKATGEALYTADLVLPRMLCGKILRSPHAHAKILNIDTSKAERLSGVKAIVTGKDTRGVKWGVFRYTRDQQLLPVDKVRYFGEEVAAVAAVDKDTAMEALELIRVDYEVLPAVFDPVEAMQPGAPRIHDHVENNVNVLVPVAVGDVEKGFAEAYYVREDRFTAVEHAYTQVEPYAVLASCDTSGNLQVWLPNASPHTKAKALANLFKMPLHKVKVRKCYSGGAFGGRSDIFPGEFIAALLARKAGRPVKIVYTREESFTSVRQVHSHIVDVKTGVRKDGTFIATEIRSIMDGGAYSSTGPIAASVPFLVWEETYRLPNVRFQGYRIYTNKPIRGMYASHGRGFLGGLGMQLDMGSSAYLKFNEDAGATLISGVADTGAGNDSMMVQIAADVLGLRMDEINLVSADSEITTLDQGSYSQAAAFVSGNAVRAAAEDARRQLLAVAAEMLEADAGTLDLRDHRVFVVEEPEKNVPLHRIIRTALLKNRPIMGRGSYMPHVDLKREWTSNPRGQQAGTFSFGAFVAEVEVDTETGQVKLVQVTGAHDCGFAINPMGVEGQIEGNVGRAGVGASLLEEHYWDNGQMLNANMLEHKVPLAVDMPPVIHPIIVESMDPEGPFGAKEAGLAGAMNLFQAVGNAIYDAIGVWIKDFPLTPDKVLEALARKGE